jgi:hypothetical protein
MYTRVSCEYNGVCVVPVSALVHPPRVVKCRPTDARYSSDKRPMHVRGSQTPHLAHPRGSPYTYNCFNHSQLGRTGENGYTRQTGRHPPCPDTTFRPSTHRWNQPTTWGLLSIGSYRVSPQTLAPLSTTCRHHPTPITRMPSPYQAFTRDSAALLLPATASRPGLLTSPADCVNAQTRRQHKQTARHAIDSRP